MNRELMMKAAIKFKGVWQDEGDTHIWLIKSGGMVSGNINEVMILDEDDIICTRKKFESFVESLFDGAPEDATHVDAERVDDYYKHDGCAHYLIGEIRSVRCANFDKLIPRPTKKLYIGDTPEQLKKGVTPQAPYMPKVGEECEYSTDGHKWHICKPLYIGNKCIFLKSHKASADGYKEYSLPLDDTEFRPIITERDTRAVELYRMFHNDGLQDREIMQSDKFDTYLSMFDILVRIQRGDV